MKARPPAFPSSPYPMRKRQGKTNNSVAALALNLQEHWSDRPKRSAATKKCAPDQCPRGKPELLRGLSADTNPRECRKRENPIDEAAGTSKGRASS